MTRVQENCLNMFYAIVAVFTKFQAIWSKNTVFTASEAAFVAKISPIEQNRDAQLASSKGVTTEKNLKRSFVVEKALFIVNRIQSYATVTANTELLDSMHYNSTKLNKCRDTEVVGYCNNIIAKANANVANLANYGITAALITELQTAVTSYSGYISKPRTATTVTKNATENLTTLFKEANDILKKRVDLDIEVFKTSNPDFYSQYQTARQIVNSNTSPSSVIGLVKALDGEVLKNASLTFTPVENGLMKAATTTTSKKVVKKSAAKGQFRIANLPEGIYNVTVRKIGYVEQVYTITVAASETTNMVIELQRA